MKRIPERGPRRWHIVVTPDGEEFARFTSRSVAQWLCSVRASINGSRAARGCAPFGPPLRIAEGA